MTKAHHGRKRREILTHAGVIEVSRIYLRCVKCQLGGYVVDDRLGIEGRYSRNAERLMCLAAASWSYDISSARLQEFCGLQVSDTTIRKVAQEHGAAANAWLRTDPEAVKEFREEVGEIEFSTDGTSVNTTQGWREVKVGIFSKRDLGEPATVAEWDSRTLPTPKVRIAFAAIEKSELFGRRWKAWRRRLGLVDTSAVTVIADGARWIWEEQRKHFTDADGVLDIFHALGHISETGHVLHADDVETRKRWTITAKDLVLKEGYSGIETFVQQDFADLSEFQQQSVNKLLDYLAPHQHRLNYSQRLKEGKTIGSGQIEGACKNLIGKRLKANAARWKIRRLNRMTGLCNIMYTDQWTKYWKNP